MDDLIAGLDRSGNGDAIVMSVSKGSFVREEGVWRKGRLYVRTLEEDFETVRDSKEAIALLNEALNSVSVT